MDTDKLSVYVNVAQKEPPVQDIPIRHDMYVMHLCLNVDYISWSKIVKDYEHHELNLLTEFNVLPTIRSGTNQWN